MNVTLKDGGKLRGFARGQGNHDLQLETLDGGMRLLTDADYSAIETEPASLMPPLRPPPANSATCWRT